MKWQCTNCYKLSQGGQNHPPGATTHNIHIRCSTARSVLIALGECPAVQHASVCSETSTINQQLARALQVIHMPMSQQDPVVLAIAEH